MDLLPQNLQQQWCDLPDHVRSMLGFPDIDFGKTWVCFNVQNVSDISLPANADRVVVTYHTEYLKHDDLLRFFSLYPDIEFLLLTDWQNGSAGLPWPQNVTYARWVTWHHQIDAIRNQYGINADIRRPHHKVSSLSFQHEFHKAAVTAYLMRNIPASDMILSWWNVKSAGRLYYLDTGYFLPSDIADLVLDKNFQNIDNIPLDSFDNTPMNNSAWAHPAYLDCLFNCSNESIYNDFCMIDDRSYKLPWPYVTEKTWKPLLAGRAFIPVGQSGTLESLTKLGLRFIPQMMDIDKVPTEFDRIFAVWRAIDWINDHSIDDLFDLTWPSTEHNLDWIGKGHFAQRCNSSNDLAKYKIQDWLRA
jgi:hypothetical protein